MDQSGNPESQVLAPLRQFQGHKRDYTLDEKLRLIVPSIFRGAIARRNPDGEDRHFIFIGAAKLYEMPYIACFDAEGWTKNYSKFPSNRSATIRMNSQSRLLLPDFYRGWIQLIEHKTKIYVQANKTRDGFEIWNQEQFDQIAQV